MNEIIIVGGLGDEPVEIQYIEASVTEVATVTAEEVEVVSEQRQGLPGPQGKSAYQVAADAGYVGSEVQWVELMETSAPNVLASQGFAIDAFGSADAAAASEGTATTRATEAGSSATAALASQDAAALSAGAASTSATASSSSADASTLSAVNADASELLASQHKLDAQAARDLAQGSQLAAATSESQTLTYRNASSASATAASGSATAASGSESAASGSATAASGSAAAALTSEQAASASKVAAAQSESSATASAVSATNSQSAAGISESAALAAEIKAQQWASETVDVPVVPAAQGVDAQYSALHQAIKSAISASAAGASESAANTARTNAQASEAAASTSASAAATSKTNAQSSATAAATSATSANTSATNATTAQNNTYAARDAAAGHSSAAATSASNASTSATSSATSATNAATSATNALGSEQKSAKWADHPENTEVEVGRYSAAHWAAKAQDSAAGGMSYRGSWDASTGTYPATPQQGWLYKVSVAGTIGGISYKVGDSIIHNGGSATLTAGWDHIDNTESVTSVAGKVGDVALMPSDVNLGSVRNVASYSQTETDGLLTSKVDNTDTRLTNAREWTAATLTQAEAEAGTATTRRAWTSQRVRQAIAAWWATITLTKADVGLPNADDTADASKNVLSATQLTTARTLTVGATGKSFNGTGNVAWTLAEIGALGATAKAADSNLLDGLDSTDFHKVGGQFVSETLPIDGASYRKRVVLLFPKSTANVVANRRVIGRLAMIKDGSNIIDIVDIYAQSAYNDTFASMQVTGQNPQGYRLVSVNYGGVPWLAIEVNYAANPYRQAYFFGVKFSDTSPADVLKIVNYYDTLNGVALDSEINDSIATFTSAAEFYLNTHKSWHAGNFNPDGKLSVASKAADSNLLDGLDSSQFLRSDASDTFAGTLTGDLLHLGGSQIQTSAAKLQVNGFQRTGSIYLHEGQIPSLTAGLLENTGGVLRWDTQQVWHSGNFTPAGKLDTTAKAADSELLDGVNSTQFLRSDISDTFTGKLAATDTVRSAGMYGHYVSTKIGHVWAMGTAYAIPDSGADFGSLYGMAYKHTNNTTGGSMAGGHQIVFCAAGTPGVSIGMAGNVWNAGIYYGRGSGLTELDAAAISTGTINAARVPTLNQDTTGNAATATKLANIITTFNGAYPVVVNVLGDLYSHPSITFNGGSGALSATSFVGSLTGNADTATNATNANNANTAGGLAVGTGVNNTANQIVRTNSSGHAEFGWINTVSGVASGTPTRVYCSQDAYLRYYDMATFTGHVQAAATGSWGISVTGNAATATTLQTARNINGVSFNGSADITLPAPTFPSRTDWATTGALAAVVGQLAWNNYGNSHTIFDASKSLTPTGTACSNTNPTVPWTVQYPTLMGFNGSSTYGVRVDRAAVAESLFTARTINGVGFNGTSNITVYDGTKLPTAGGTLSGVLATKVTGHSVGVAYGDGSLSVKGDAGSGAVMSFHRAGVYAINMGIDTDNIFRLGGWSNGVNVYRFTSDTVGNFVANGNVTAFSDARIKTNLKIIPDALAKTLSLTGYTFDRTDIPEGLRQTGVIAQDVLGVLPEAVIGGPTAEDPEAMYSVAYGNMVGLLIEAIKELKVEVDELKARVV
jgi:hypothetical protein